MDWTLFWLVPVASLIALGFALYFFRSMKSADEGTSEMKRIAQAVREGAGSYLRQQYKVVGYVFLVLFILFAIEDSLPQRRRDGSGGCRLRPAGHLAVVYHP